MNQLDGQKVALYPRGTIIPNPRRRRIERALTIARADEGRARRALAALDALDRRRERVEAAYANHLEQSPEVIVRLLEATQRRRAALLCVEAVADQCHRSLLARHVGALAHRPIVDL